MEPPHVNLEDILKMPESEFKQNFREWLENDGVARSLQAKLRKDLIDTFNKTSLGRKIFYQHQKSSRIMLSPLILALNTLVAEFLYAQHCHYSLSVFSTEVPYRNILPDFENSEQFRFSREELLEIFDAVSGDIQLDLKSNVISQYLNASEEANRSLLYLILKNFFRKFEEPEKVIKEPEKCFENNQNHEVNSENETKKSKKDSYRAYNTHFRYLNKYLVILSRKVKEMAQSLEQLQKREGDAKNVRRKSLRNRKLERLNKSLEKISENLRHLSISKRKNKNISVVLTAVDKMAQQFEKCAFNFETISQKIREEKREKSENSYPEWITELKNSRNGRKFILKVENSLRKALEREKQKMQDDFDIQLESHKDLIRLKYKQKLLQQVEKQPPKEDDENSEKAKKFVQEKLKELDKKHQELLQKLLESEERLKNSPKPDTIKEELVSTKNVAVITDEPKLRSASTETEKPNLKSSRIEKGKRKQTQTTAYNSTVKPQLEEMAKTIAQNERNIDHIVFDAKLRVQELEHESNQLERSFQEYLKRQKETKEHMEESVSTIWDKYNFEKKMLHKKSEILRASRLNMEQMRFQREFNLGFSVPNVPSIEINAGDENIRASAPDITAFENPFRKLKNEMLFKGDLFRHETKTHGVKDETTHRFTNSKDDKLKSPERGDSSEEKKNRSLDDKPKSPGSSAEGKKNLLLLLSQKPSTVKEITHEETMSKESKTSLNVPSKIEEITKISLDQSGLSSDINLKDISLDEINISGSKSSSNRSDERVKKSGPNCRRSLFSKMDQTSVFEKRQEENVVLKNVEKKSLEPNIFEPSSFSKSEKGSNKEEDRISNKVEVVEVTKTPDFHLEIPGTSPKTLSSSNSTSTSFKLNLSVGRGDASAGDDFWS